MDGKHYATFTIVTPEQQTIEVDVLRCVKNPDLENLHHILIDAPELIDYGIKHFNYYCKKCVNNYAVDANVIKDEIIKLDTKCSPDCDFTPESSGLKFVNILETRNKTYAVENDQTKLELFKKRQEEINKVYSELETLKEDCKKEYDKPHWNKKGYVIKEAFKRAIREHRRKINAKENELGRLEYEKELEPLNEYKTITSNLYVYKVADLKTYWNYIENEMIGDDYHFSAYLVCGMLGSEYENIPYKLSKMASMRIRQRI